MRDWDRKDWKILKMRFKNRLREFEKDNLKDWKVMGDIKNEW